MKIKFKPIAILTLLLLLSITLSSCSGQPYDYKLEEHIRIADYTQIKIDENLIEAQIEKYKTDLLSAHSVRSEEQIFGRPLREGDIAVVTYKCYTEESLLMPVADPVPSEPAPVLEDTNCEIVLGSGKYPPAFESGIINVGVSSREHEWHILLPDDFGIKKLAGKNVVFFVTVNGGYEFVQPQYDDVFIARVTKYSSVKEYEAAMREQARFQLVWDELISKTEVISYPQDELREHRNDFIEYYSNLAGGNVELSAFIEKNFFIDSDNFHLTADEYSKNYTKEEMAVYAIARQSGLELTDDEYRINALEYAKEYDYDSLSDFESIYGKAFIRYSILKDSVMRYVTYNSLSSPDLVPPPESDTKAETGA